MRHQVGEAQIVIAFYPHDFDIALWIRELANKGEKLPVLFLESAEIQVVEDVAQQNQTPKGCGLKQVQCVPGPADLRAQMDIGQNERVEYALHAPILVQS